MHFSDLDQQHAGSFHFRVFAADVRKVVGKPSVADGQRTQQLALHFALRAFEHERMIGFAAWLEDARDYRDQEARTDCTQIFCVLVGVQISLQPVIDSRRAIPNQRVEIFAHRMEGIVTRHRLDRAADITLRCFDVLALKPDACLGFVLIGQRHVYSCRTPRRRLANDDTIRELVESEHAFPYLMMP
jgi:hypothetical protein